MRNNTRCCTGPNQPKPAAPIAHFVVQAAAPDFIRQPTCHFYCTCTGVKQGEGRNVCTFARDLCTSLHVFPCHGVSRARAYLRAVHVGVCVPALRNTRCTCCHIDGGASPRCRLQFWLVSTLTLLVGVTVPPASLCPSCAVQWAQSTAPSFCSLQLY